MKYNRLGTSDIEVSEFTLGCWPFAGGNVWGDQDDADSIAAVHASLDAGINFFDTADTYGTGYGGEILAKAFKKQRHEIIIGTKFHHPLLEQHRLLVEPSIEFIVLFGELLF